ncbi:MAG: sensor histidine kinase [Candidatus Nitrosocosmicus sp.]
MSEHNEHITNQNNNYYPSKIDKKFLDRLYEFIHSVESQMDILLPGIAGMQFLSYYKIIDDIITQKLAKNIIIRLLCPFDDDNAWLNKHLVPYIGYRSIKPSLPLTPSNSLFFIRDKREIFSFSVNIKGKMHLHCNQASDTIFFLDNCAYSKDIPIVKNAVYSFDLIWEEKENHDKTTKEKMHSELLFDLISHDIGNYHQIIQSNLNIVTSIVKRNNNDTNSLSQNSERIVSALTTAKKALDKSQSLVDNIRRLERLYTQKDLKLILKNLPNAINNAFNTLEQTLYDNNPQGKRIRFSLNVIDDHIDPNNINIIAEELLEEIFVNLFSNSLKYTETSEVKIDVLIREYYIGNIKYWMVTVSDYGKGIPDSMKKELFKRFYSKAEGSGLGLSIVRTLVERYKGKIWIGNRVYEDCTQGTSFGMIFPAAQ